MSVDGLSFYWRDFGTIGGQAFLQAAGSPTPAMPYSETLGPITVEIAAGDTLTIWSAASSPVTGFDFLYVMAGDYPTVDNLDGDGATPALSGQLEMTCNNGNAAEQIWIEQLRASFPYRRFSDVSRYDISSGGSGFSGTAGVVDQIRYKNDTTDTVVLRFFLARQ